KRKKQEAEGEAGQTKGETKYTKKRRKKGLLITKYKNYHRKTKEEVERAKPWIMEDANKEHVFHGTLEGGQEAHYVLFVLEGEQIRVIPSSYWYKFRPYVP